MKTNIKHAMWLLTLAATSFFVACSDGDDPEVEVDKTELNATIAVATDLLANSQEGTAEGQFQLGAKAELQTAVDLAQQVSDSETVTQVQVDNANTALEQAIVTFEGKEVVAIEPDALVGHWTFDEGTGTSTTDYSGNERDGTLSAGHANWGAGTPEWVSDRYGNAGKALHFDDGANVEIPYATALNPQQMSITLWVKGDVVDPIWANNYMISLNRWNGFKFQLQEANKAFMTVKANVDGNENPVYYDRDNESPTLDQDVWYHLAVTFGGGEMTFYINGTEVKKWDNTPGTAISIADAPVNLTIGQDLPTGTYSSDDTSPYYVDWGGYFKGTLDEIRIYNKVLSSTQVGSIYDLEKPID
ncbi:MAG: LamG-like jellyroll fold domain-containing protein [Marinoscillum sp.]|uniref:LamG-like jellyroll fold domain-containing protein n=1 Tax=Marinoscillum sp. TaxID=2024838 RepID=UPI00330048D7